MNDKELLNIILYEKRFATYAVCLVMILAGVILGFVKVSDDEVMKAYGNTAEKYVYCDDADGLKNFRTEIRGKEIYAVCEGKDRENTAGIYMDGKYLKTNFGKNAEAKLEISEPLEITGYVIIKRKTEQK